MKILLGLLICCCVFSWAQEKANPVNRSGAGTSVDPEDATVEGLDVDNNGVRDDLQRYIDTTYPGSENALLRQALTEVAKSSQQVLLSVQAGDEFEVVSNIIIDFENRQCLYGLFGEAGFDYADEMLFEILDTRARMNLDFEADAIFADEIYTPLRNPLDGCKFDILEANQSPE